MSRPVDAAARRIETVRDWLTQPVVSIGIGLIIGVGVFRAWLLSDGWFFQDDYEMLTFARTTPVTLEHLLRPDNGHVMPGTRLAYLLVAHSGWLNWSLAAAIAVVLQVSALVAALIMLTTLFGPRWWVLAPLSVYATTAMTAQAAMWWISVINQTPVQIAFFGSVACWVGYLRQRRGTDLAGTVGFLVFGLLFFQKILLVVPVLIWIMLAYFVEGGLRRRVRVALQRYWPSAVVVGLVTGGYTVYFLAAVPDATGGSVVNQSWAPTFRAMFLQAFASGVVGGPNGWRSVPGGAWADPSPWQLVWSWALIIAVVLLSLLLHKRAGRAWVMLLGYYVMLAGLISITRSEILGAERGLAYRLQTDGACAAVLALGLAYMPLRGVPAGNHLAPRTAPRAVTRAAPYGAVLLLVVVAVNGLGNWHWFARDFQRHNDGRTYVTALHEEERRLGALHLNDPVLPSSVRVWLSAKNRLSHLSTILVPRATFPDVSDRLAMVTDRGRVHQAMLEPATSEVGRPPGDCGWRIDPGHRQSVQLSRKVSGPHWLRLGYLGTATGSARVQFGNRTQTVPLRRGLHSLFVRVDGEFENVVIDEVGGGDVAICLDTVQAGVLRPGPQL